MADARIRNITDNRWTLLREAFRKKNKGKNEIGTFSSDTPPPYPKSEKNNSEIGFKFGYPPSL